MGKTAKRKVSHDDMLATSLTQTAKQSCEPQARAAVRCMMTRHGYGRRSLRCQSTVTPKATPRHSVQTESFIPQCVAEQERRGKLGMDSAREVLSRHRVGHKTTQRRRSGTSRSDSENLGRRTSSRESQRRGRTSAEALSR